jgi:uncharacterized coiled-coil protein SlyX
MEPTIEEVFTPRQPPICVSPRRARECAVSLTSAELKVHRFYNGKPAPDPESRPGMVALHASAGRDEVRALATRLHDALNTGDCAHADLVWSNLFSELVRQVQVHTCERGELLETVRAHYEAKVKALQEQVRSQQTTVKKLQGDMSLLFGSAVDEAGGSGSDPEEGGADTSRGETAARDTASVSTAQLGSKGGPGPDTPLGSKSGLGFGAAPTSGAAISRSRPSDRELAQRADERRQKRTQMILTAARTMRPAERAKLGLDLMKDGEEGAEQIGSGEVIHHLLASVPAAQRGTLLAEQILRLPATDALATFAAIADGSSDQARSGLFGVVGRLMSEQEREMQLIEMMSTSDPSSRANIASGMLSQLPLAERQKAVVRTIQRLPRHERVYILRDSFSELNIAESVDVVAGKASDMDKEERESFYCKHLDQLSCPERAVVIEMHLVGLPADTRGRLIGSVAGMCTGPERKKIWMMLGGEKFGNMLNLKGVDSDDHLVLDSKDQESEY